MTIKKSKKKILPIVYSLKSVIIMTECLSYHTDTNKRNNCLNLICTLNVYLNGEY